MVADQSFASMRSDVLIYTSPQIEETLKLQGPLKVKLDLAVSSEDADIVVKFIDLHPDGYQMLVRGDVFPIRYRYAYDRPVKANPGEILHIDFTMNDIAHWIMPGHRMMVQIQSSWFPLVNLNPQTYLANIYEADMEDYVSSEITIYHQKDAPSHIVLPIVR